MSPACRGMWLRSCVTWGRCIIGGRLMMRRSLLNCTNFFPGCDVKYLAPGRCDASGGLYRPCALNPCGASRRTGTRGGLVAVPGFEPGCPLGHVLLRDACIRSTRQRDSPCLLVKGADCAGDRGGSTGLSRFWKARLPAGMIRAHAGRLIKLCAPCYREGASGYLLVIATRASDSKWSGKTSRSNAPQ